jgi:LysM repeat protein
MRHVVSPGETLVDIAARYAVSQDALRRQNRLDGGQLATGTVLEIPVSGT